MQLALRALFSPTAVYFIRNTASIFLGNVIFKSYV